MDVDEIRAAARLAPEHEAEPETPYDQDKALVAFMEHFASVMLSTAEAVVGALDKACEDITGSKPLPGEGARALFEAAKKSMSKAVAAAVAPPAELSAEAKMAKEAALIAVATGTTVDEIIAGMKRLADTTSTTTAAIAKVAEALKPKPRARLWINGFPAAESSHERETFEIASGRHFEFTFSPPGGDTKRLAERIADAIRFGQRCMIRYGTGEYKLDQDTMRRFLDGMLDLADCVVEVRDDRKTMFGEA